VQQITSRLEIRRSWVSATGNTKMMNIHAIHSTKYPINRWALLRQDILMVSAFSVWSVILGLLPVLVLHALIAN
jgi:hypothetical protein